MRQNARLVLFVVAASLMLVGIANAGNNEKSIDFDMVVSAGAANCLPNATAHVDVTSKGAVEVMTVGVQGLPANTDFDFFVIQAPTAPFGLSWYQGDIETDGDGNGKGVFVGRFNIETFIVAPGQVTGTPTPFTDTPFPDQSSNLGKEGPVHTYHLGLWFNSPNDASSAGCASTVTPFNGPHNAGIQVLNTSNFPANAGPLQQLVP